MRKWMAGAVALTTVFVSLNLSACGLESSTDFDRTMIQVQKDGHIRATEVDVLDKDIYDFNELKTMAQETVDDYNEKGAGKVTLETVETLDATDGSVRIVIDYESTEDYIAFNTPISNSCVLFFGTVSEAMAQGYQMVNMREADPSKTDPAVYNQKEIEAMGEKQLLITSEKVQVSLPEKIMYVSEDAALTVEESQREAILVDSSTGLFYLLLK